MSGIDDWLRTTRSRAASIADAYRSTLTWLWWANLLFVVVPAILSTAAAIVAALPAVRNREFDILGLGVGVPLASAFAGTAAILLAVHKALRCEEYQAECLRLAHSHQGIAMSAES